MTFRNVHDEYLQGMTSGPGAAAEKTVLVHATLQVTSFLATGWRSDRLDGESFRYGAARSPGAVTVWVLRHVIVDCWWRHGLLPRNALPIPNAETRSVHAPATDDCVCACSEFNSVDRVAFISWRRYRGETENDAASVRLPRSMGQSRRRLHSTASRGSMLSRKLSGANIVQTLIDDAHKGCMAGARPPSSYGSAQTLTGKPSVQSTANTAGAIVVDEDSDNEDFSLLPYPSARVGGSDGTEPMHSESAERHSAIRRKPSDSKSEAAAAPARGARRSGAKVTNTVAFSHDSDRDTSDLDGDIATSSNGVRALSSNPHAGSQYRVGTDSRRRSSKVAPVDDVAAGAAPGTDRTTGSSSSSLERDSASESGNDSESQAEKAKTRKESVLDGDAGLRKTRSVATSSATKSATLFFHRAIERDASKTEPSLTLLRRLLYLVWLSVITLILVIFSLDRNTMSASLAAGIVPWCDYTAAVLDSATVVEFPAAGSSPCPHV